MADLKLNFDRRHSHRWFSHVEAWRGYLGSHPGEEAAGDVAYTRKMLPADGFGIHYTPLMTSLMYALGMDQKMSLEIAALKEVFPGQNGLEGRIQEDTDMIMDLFVDDGRALFLGIGDGRTIDGILGGSRDYSRLALGNTWEEALTQEPSRENADGIMAHFVRARLAQEYWTIMGAVTAYHLVNELGFEAVDAAIAKNADAIAWRITGRLSEVIKTAKAAGVKDTDGMRTDHNITRLEPSRLKMLVAPDAAARYFNNCPIFEAYSTVDRILSGKYGTKRAFGQGMPFCRICAQHAEQSVNYFLPTWILVHPDGADPDRISGGDSRCSFESTMQINPFGDGKQRRHRAELYAAVHPRIRPYGG